LNFSPGLLNSLRDATTAGGLSVFGADFPPFEEFLNEVNINNGLRPPLIKVIDF
jgi:hypothetical protein